MLWGGRSYHYAVHTRVSAHFLRVSTPPPPPPLRSFIKYNRHKNGVFSGLHDMYIKTERTEKLKFLWKKTGIFHVHFIIHNYSGKVWGQ